jgi:cyclic beta-1,2-glucan synthetase
MMRALPGTLVAEACATAVARQIAYGEETGIPWGISESAFSAQYPDGDYRYQAFGVPGLGLKRGLDRDLVVAPYAAAMASMIAPHATLRNFRRLTELGAAGRHGFHEAIDFTPDRLLKGQDHILVRSFMAHHQGMSLVAMTNALLGDPMPRRFHAEPMVRAVELLLQERMPQDAALIATKESDSVSEPAEHPADKPLLSRRITTPHTPMPRTHVLSNSSYHVILTNAGGGRSVCRDLDVTRWREDATRDAHCLFCYVRDLDHDLLWSAGYQPVCRASDDYEVLFAADKATFRRRDGGIETTLEVAVSPETCAEVRRVTLTNHDSRPRTLELTSYAEIVLAPHGADLAHPAFGRLFLETEWIEGSEALVCHRRPRTAEDPEPWAVHVVAVDRSATGGIVEGPVQYETDRARFLGRGRTTANPQALEAETNLSGTTGPVLDPIFSLRVRFVIPPGGSVSAAFTTAVTENRDAALAVADQFRLESAVARAFELAWAYCQLEHRHGAWSPDEAHLFQRLGSHVIFAGSAQRAAPAIAAANRQGQPSLWRYGISGDRPMVVAKIDAIKSLPIVRSLLTAHAFLRTKGIAFDLILLNEESSSYFEQTLSALHEAIRDAGAAELTGKPGGVFLCKSSQMPEADHMLLLAAARAVFDGHAGSLAVQLDRIERLSHLPDSLVASKLPEPWPDTPVRLPDGLQIANGFGGFTADGREYCILAESPFRAPVDGARRSALPPAPWINVIANPSAGFLISETGGGYSWTVNSQSNRLTPWRNDPVSDSPGEVIYLRDEETGEFWSPSPLPVESLQPTLVRHGQGYTILERNAHGIEQELLTYMHVGDPVKRIQLRVTNPGERPRRLTATYYVEWVLGTTREATAMHVVTEHDAETGALFARNAFSSGDPDRVGFVAADRPAASFTADRHEFLGRNGSTAAPAALARVGLSGRVGPLLDPCGTIQVAFTLEPGGSTELTFLLGQCEHAAEARDLLAKHCAPGASESMIAEVKAYWSDRLGTIQVETPDTGMNQLLNSWLLNQVVSCRLFARSALYQSGGAYGFRDQLQDVMAVVHAAPELAREQILRAAARQFEEGDVQHWWHPPEGRGVRTRISDDFLWLPYVSAQYAVATGDWAIFDEALPFLNARPLEPGQEDDYGLPEVTAHSQSLFEHCLRALEHGMTKGPHGLPLMGTGDWNDGMNRVGAEGKGESVWVAWFLIATIRRFSAVADRRETSERWDRIAGWARSLGQAIETSAWDGDWYLRAYFDDGTPLGSARNEECQIDSIVQSWAVISGAGDRDRAIEAMGAVDRRLVRDDARLILLFDPPFDSGTLTPGYIKGYLPGIRENGGQYTHAATWVVLANALLGRGDRAWELFKLLDPTTHAENPDEVNRYKVEPYVVAADVYGRPPHVGRGGWTWYTGSAAWLYRVGLESILGFERKNDRLFINPCLPASWSGYSLTYRYGRTMYTIRVENPDRVERGISRLRVNGVETPEKFVHLVDDGTPREAVVTLAPG